MRPPAGAVALLLLGASCGDDTHSPVDATSTSALTPTEFAAQGVAALEHAMASQFGVGVEGSCDEPVSVEPETTFRCTGTRSGGEVIGFVATITGDNEVAIALVDVP